jgi:AcrR family transcriptional regulator
MIENDNSVNIKTYHHGDLRSAALAEGLKQLATISIDALSLRSIARNTGVSATALYRHFQDKQAFLLALAEYGSEQLGQQQQAAMRDAGGGMKGFSAAGQAYVRFAVNNPALFRLCMGSFRATVPNSDTDIAMTLLKSIISELLPEGTDQATQNATVMQCWSMVHGLAMLMLDGQIPAEERIIKSVISPSYLAKLL